jgi:hypothetical protein
MLIVHVHVHVHVNPNRPRTVTQVHRVFSEADIALIADTVHPQPLRSASADCWPPMTRANADAASTGAPEDAPIW